MALLPRILVAVVVVLALLCGIAPFKSASAGNLCAMACCASQPPHAAGSCHMEMSASGKPGRETAPTPESDNVCGLPEGDKAAIKGIAAGVMGMKDNVGSSLNLDSVTVDAYDHCQVNSQIQHADVPTSGDSDQAASIAAHSFAKPCPPECGNGTTVSRVRRSPDAATIAQTIRPRSTLVRKYQRYSQDSSILFAYGKQVRPRGPPVCCS
jgi:hypothetical protein